MISPLFYSVHQGTRDRAWSRETGASRQRAWSNLSGTSFGPVSAKPTLPNIPDTPRETSPDGKPPNKRRTSFADQVHMTVDKNVDYEAFDMQSKGMPKHEEEDENIYDSVEINYRF